MIITSDRRIRLALIFGGRSGEHEVSLMSAKSVLAVLDARKYEVTQVVITPAGEWLAGKDALEKLSAGRTADLTPVVLSAEPGKRGLLALRANKAERLAEIDVYFPLLHGTFGEDGTIQGLLELAGAAYVGAGVLASSVGMDKALFKDVMRANGIPVTESILVLRSEVEKDINQVAERVEKMSSYPVFTKPANLGSSVGITKCNSRSDLCEGLLDACSYDRRLIVEHGVANPREIEVSVLGNEDPRASVPGEILPSREFYSYEAKYVDGSSGLLIPAPLPEATRSLAQDLAVRAFRAIDGAGMARVDFLLDKDTGTLVLNEINTIPGFTEISMYPKLWAASGIAYGELVDRLVDLALQRQHDRARTSFTYRSHQ